MTERDLHDDDVILAALGQAFDAAEAGSPAAEALARSAVDLGRIEGELAELVADSYVDRRDRDLALRATDLAEGRALAFRSGGFTLDLDLDPDGRTVVGQLSPPSTGEVELQVGTGRITTVLDDLGRFLFEAADGPIRIVVRAGGTTLTTPWITR